MTAVQLELLNLRPFLDFRILWKSCLQAWAFCIKATGMHANYKIILNCSFSRIWISQRLYLTRKYRKVSDSGKCHIRLDSMIYYNHLRVRSFLPVGSVQDQSRQQKLAQDLESAGCHLSKILWPFTIWPTYIESNNTWCSGLKVWAFEEMEAFTSYESFSIWIIVTKFKVILY